MLRPGQIVEEKMFEGPESFHIPDTGVQCSPSYFTMMSQVI